MEGLDNFKILQLQFGKDNRRRKLNFIGGDPLRGCSLLGTPHQPARLSTSPKPPNFHIRSQGIYVSRAIERDCPQGVSQRVAEWSQGGGWHVCARLRVVRRKWTVALQDLQHHYPPLSSLLSFPPSFSANLAASLLFLRHFRTQGL